MKHTSGPWNASGVTVYGGEGARVTVADTTCCGSLTRSEDEGNARFIAAAPDMLEALELVLFAVTADADTNDGNMDRHGIALTVRKALAKANA